MDFKPRFERCSGQAVALLSLPVLLVGYVLSIGPAARLAIENRIPQKSYHAAYDPLLLVSDKRGMLGWLQWYMLRWLPNEFIIEPCGGDNGANR